MSLIIPCSLCAIISPLVLMPIIEILSKYNNNFQIMVRWSNGLDIDAGCGQLAISNNNKGD